MKRIILLTATGLALGIISGAAAAQDRGGPMARVDGDGDGIITRAEFIEARLAPLRRLDTDGDGAITRAEVDAARAAAAERAGAQSGPRRERGERPRGPWRVRAGERGAERLPVTLAEVEARAEARFTRLDLDGDGRLTTTERHAQRARMRAARTGRLCAPDAER